MDFAIELLIKARFFAGGAHAAVGQKRKYTGDDYIVHPTNVVKLMMQYGIENEFALAAAWLHDVVEDTDITFAQLDLVFPHMVVKTVGEVTQISGPEDGNRAIRKAMDLEHYASASNMGQAIKVADLMDNTISIVAHDPKFAAVYLPEKRALLERLVLAPDDMLDAAQRQLEEAERLLEVSDEADAS